MQVCKIDPPIQFSVCKIVYICEISLRFVVDYFPVAVEKEPGDECQKETSIYAVTSYQESSEQH